MVPTKLNQRSASRGRSRGRVLKRQPQGMKRTRRAFVALLAAVVLAFGVGSAAYANPIDDVVGAVTSFFTGSSSDESSDAGVSTQAVDDAQNTVQGVSPRGTTINLFDYWLTGESQDNWSWTDLLNAGGADNRQTVQELMTSGINDGNTFKFGNGMTDVSDVNEVNYWTGTADPRTGIVASTLNDEGYPQFASQAIGGSLAYLFDSSEFDGKSAYMDVNGLLQVDDNGYYYYSSKENFAQFNKSTKDFTLYNSWGVVSGGASQENGQFFPFDDGTEVFNQTADGGISPKPSEEINSTADSLNHYFGMSMSTQFVQQYGGHTSADGRTDVTYNFSGDDDVWIYIDGVLVGDLGGIHDATSIQINFSTGDIIVYNDQNGDNEYNRDDDGSPISQTTLRDAFDVAGVSTAEFADGSNGTDRDTFADGTYHTLDFFYLERGAVDSNMSLRYNLVNIPESGVVKVDQSGEPLTGVSYTLQQADSDYNIVENGMTVDGVTGDNGEMVFSRENATGEDVAITLEQMSEVSAYWVLTEQQAPTGYRNPGAINLRFSTVNQNGTGDGVLLASNEWDTGAYSQAHVTASAPAMVQEYDNSGATHDLSAENNAGTLFAVVMQHVDTNDDGTADAWYPISGDAFSGWSVEPDGTDASIKSAAKASGYQFLPGSSGAYEATIENLPGDVTKYEYMLEQTGDENAAQNAEYSVWYYWTDAESLQSMDDSSNIVRVQDDAVGAYQGIGRVFSVTLNVSNIKNELTLHKTNADGSENLQGATYTLYNDVNGDGDYDADTDTVARTGLTTDGNGELQVWSGTSDTTGEDILANGSYVLVETSAPSGYQLDETPIQIVVDDDGVHVNAGTADDNVKVETGLGTLAWSMKGFAAGDDVDATLHDVVAQAQVANSYSGAGTSWDTATNEDGSDVTPIHYQYDDQAQDLSYEVATVENNGTATYTADAGWSRLDVKQCLDHEGIDSPKQDLGDENNGNGIENLNALFTGDVTIHVTNSQIPTTSSLTISKTVTGEGAPSDATFDFNFALTDADGNPVTGTFSATTHHADGSESTADMVIYADADRNQLTLGNGESVTINGLSIGTNYAVTEVAKAYYEPSVQSGTPDEETGNLTTTGTIDADGATAAFTNDFWGGKVDYDQQTSIDIVKTLTGRDAAEGESFSFVLQPLDEKSADLFGISSASNHIDYSFSGAQDGVKHSIDILAGKDITFTDDNVGTYSYTVSERHEGENPSNGTTYDETVYNLTIVASVDANGVVSVTTTATDNVSFNKSFTLTGEHHVNTGIELPFVNVYEATGELGGNGSASIKATKVLENDTLEAGDFTFSVAAVNSDGTDERVEATTTNGTNGAASAADIVFPAIEYDSESLAQDVTDGYARARVNNDGTTTYTYLYRAYEDTSGFDGSGLTTSQSSYNVTVRVTDDGDGSLEVEVGYPTGSENGITFTNVYGASASATLNVAGTKIYETNGLVNAPDIVGKYTFTLTGVDEDGNPAPLPDTTTATNQANGTVDFGTITYDIADLGGADSKTFTYTVTESGGVDGVTNDGAASTGKTFTVTLTDNGKGTISVDSDAQQAAGSQFSFTNEYSVDPTDPTDPTDPGTDPTDPTTAALTISKVLTGRAMNEGEFSFTMAAAGDYGNAVSPTSITATNTVNEDGTGSVVFGDGFVFTEPGTYRFTISEDTGTLGGVGYDGSDYTATAVVTDDGAGNLSVAWTVADAEGNAVSEITFENTYTTSATTPVELKVSKELQDGTLADGQFTFELTGSDGAPMPESTTATNNAQGVVSFGSITFDAVGEYDYTVTEVNDGQDGITYDEDATRTIHVSVTDDGEGHLVAEVTYGSDGSHFVNVNTTGGNNDGGDNGDGGNGGDNGGTGDAGNGSGNGSSFAQTNDAAPWPLAMALALVAAGAIIAAVFGLRRAQR